MADEKPVKQFWGDGPAPQVPPSASPNRRNTNQKPRRAFRPPWWNNPGHQPKFPPYDEVGKIPERK